MTETNTLADFFGVEKMNFHLVDSGELLRRTALLVIDAQRDFVHPRHWGTSSSLAVAKGLRPLVKKFRAAGIAPYWVYYREKNLFGADKFPRRAFGGFYGARPRWGEPLIGKTKASAFEGSAIHGRLQEDGIRHLIVSGFNTSACVQATVEHALDEGYSVCVAEDMTENGAMPACASYTLRMLEEKGAIVADSASILDYISKPSF